MSETSLPRENLFRAITPGPELRTSGDGATLTGHFAVFDQWTEIDSVWEGNFMERLAPGSFAKTFREQTPKVLFQHGMDPQIGDKPLGSIDVLREDKTGAYYEASLLDTLYNRELLPGLKAGLYGASFRFKVLREAIDEEPGVSASNPNGLPERTIKEARVMEFGPVTFPAYAGATAGVRSITDELVLARYAASPKERELYETWLGKLAARFDNEDVSTLAQMIALGTEFIDDQDEPDEAGNVTTMEGVLTTLSTLLSGETTETEPDEDEDENEGRNAPSPADAAPSGTSDTERRATAQTWPHVSQEEFEDLWNRRT